LKFQAVAEKTAKDARGLLYFAAPGRTVKCGMVIRGRGVFLWLSHVPHTK